MRPLTIAVTGLNATDNPGPGVPVIRAIRHQARRSCHIIGLSYDPLDPGNYMSDVADRVYLMPYPSQGTRELLDRISYIHEGHPIDVLIPTLDSELPAYLKILDRLEEMGIRTFLPGEEQLAVRSKSQFNELKTDPGINVPKSLAIHDEGAIGKLDDEFAFPVMVKGQFYDASVAYSPMEVERHFQRIRAKWGAPVIIQEFIAGEEYDVAAVGDGEGLLVGAIPMRKMQITDKGKAWGGITIRDPRLSDFVADAVRKLKWRGPCELEVMKAKDDGELYLLEINPRFPAWIYLAVGADRNLPWATVRLALGERVEPMDPPEPGVMFLRHSYDQICTLDDYESITTRGEIHRSPGRENEDEQAPLRKAEHHPAHGRPGQQVRADQ